MTYQEALKMVGDSYDRGEPLAALVDEPKNGEYLLMTTDGVDISIVTLTSIKLEQVYILLKKKFDIHPESAKRYSGDDDWPPVELDRDERSSVNPNNGRTTTW